MDGKSKIAEALVRLRQKITSTTYWGEEKGYEGSSSDVYNERLVMKKDGKEIGRFQYDIVDDTFYVEKFEFSEVAFSKEDTNKYMLDLLQHIFRIMSGNNTKKTKLAYLKGSRKSGPITHFLEENGAGVVHYERSNYSDVTWSIEDIKKAIERCVTNPLLSRPGSVISEK